MSISVMLPARGTTTPVEADKKSLTHWVWNPYTAINNLQAWGIESLLGYRKEAWTRFERCVPYPLGNMESSSPDRQAAEEAFQASFAVNSASLPSITHVRYAQDQAAEMGERYGGLYGLRVLLPFIGVDDFELVNRIIQVVQPFAYDIHEMEYEFTAGVEKRIKESNLSDSEKVVAREVAGIMLNGSRRALVRADEEYEKLISSMSDKSVGQPGISNPNEFHAWICRMLGKPVPERVNRTPSQQPVVVVQQDNTELNALRQEMAELKSQLSKKPGQKAREAEAA
jgi:hypothetical protein